MGILEVMVMGSVFHHRQKEEHTSVSSYIILIGFIALLGFVVVSALGNEWNSLMYTLHTIASR